MNIKTNLLEEYVNFVDTTKKQNKHSEMIIIFLVICMFLLLFFLLPKYLKGITVSLYNKYRKQAILVLI